ncbi:hypothetical protein Acr_08g0014850 [Actinidia rufa]|uniref:Uncharacterized protein n=1 Tax=Actinidia rufa TaxID=165716 RepID=A0A7J0F4B5_9ERIC|nr:hypothetical protein Acr_08g0014850 [Actinidia rufa]
MEEEVSSDEMLELNDNLSENETIDDSENSNENDDSSEDGNEETTNVEGKIEDPKIGMVFDSVDEFHVPEGGYHGRSDYRVLRNMKANKKKVETKKSKETENALDQNMKANKMITKACKGNPHPSTSWMSSQLSCTELLKGMVSVGNSRLDKSGGS